MCRVIADANRDLTLAAIEGMTNALPLWLPETTVATKEDRERHHRPSGVGDPTKRRDEARS